MVSEEFIKERPAFSLTHTANYLDGVIQAPVTHHIAYRPAGAGFWIPCTKHEPRDARQNNRSGAHGAWFERDGERSEEHTSELQSRGHLVCRLLLEKKKYKRRRADRS